MRAEDGTWVFTEFVGPDAVCRFASVSCEIPLAALYEGIDLTAEQNPLRP